MAALAGRHVLVVDDDEAIREVVRDILEEAGYRVWEAPDGAPALERLRQHPQGMVVLLDLNMPGVDGLAVLRAVADDASLRARFPIIVLTARYGPTLPLADAQLLTQGALALLPKPFAVDDLLAAVAAAARRIGQ